MPWNYGDVLEAVAAVVPPGAPFTVHGDNVTLWGDGIKRMNNLARAMIARGAKPKDKVAFYLRNSAEYSEALGACFLARLTHVNVNYRYKPDEVRYILDNSDAQTLIYRRGGADPQSASQGQDLHRGERRRRGAVRAEL
jgi:fatty-acyl-CoA synthase